MAVDPKSSSLSVQEGLSKIQREQKETAIAEQAKTMKIPYIDLRTINVNSDLLRMMEPEAAKAAMVVPFYKLGNKMRIAIAHPTNPQTRAMIKKFKDEGFLLNINLTTEESVMEALAFFDSDQYVVKKKEITETGEIKEYEKEIEMLKEIEKKIPTVTSAEAVNMINIGAIKTGTSDVHYEPEEHFVKVRFRIDGVLHKIFEINRKTFANISNQLKYISKMKLNVTEVPQDGRYSFMVNDRKVDVRVSALPTEFGETFVCRLLDSGKKFLSFEEMGFMNLYLNRIQKLTEISQGMILVTGPTGSGKTTTLYSMLQQFNSPENKVITLEDPIEYHLDGISQSPVNEKRGYTFGSGLRSILRQDPDVVLIGEIRDLETANTAAQASLTGHVVLSTLHTNSAVETIPRLVNIGLQPFMVAPSVHTIIAQRLVRRICPDCQELKPLEKSKHDEVNRSLAAIKQVWKNLDTTIPEQLPHANGCEKCSHTGYKGRMVITEILPVDFELRELILNNESSMKLITAARKKGMITMREDGILKVLHGYTTLDEVYRVTNVSEL